MMKDVTIGHPFSHNIAVESLRKTMRTTVQVVLPTADLPVASVAVDVLVVVPVALVALVASVADQAVVTEDPPNENAVPILMLPTGSLSRKRRSDRYTGPSTPMVTMTTLLTTNLILLETSSPRHIDYLSRTMINSKTMKNV